jgi:hypothetical protein
VSVLWCTQTGGDEVNDQPDELVLVCECSRLDHAIRFTRWPHRPGEPFDRHYAYVDVVLVRHRPWWRRLVTAVRYALGMQTCRYGEIAEVLVSRDDVPKLQAWLERARMEACGAERDGGVE